MLPSISTHLAPLRSPKVTTTILVILSLLLMSCAGQQTLKQQQDAPASLNSKPLVQEQAPHYKPIPKDTLEALLIAEFAGQRQAYDIALTQYLSQAQQTSDASIAERALRIAQYVDDKPAIEEASTLWLNAEPDHPSALNAVAEIKLKKQQFEESLTHYTQLYTLHKVARFDYFAANISLREESLREKSLHTLASLSEAYPEEANLLYAQAILQQSFDNNEHALKLTNQALSYNPDMSSAALQKGRLLAKMERIDDAINWLNQVVERSPKQKSPAVLRAKLLLQQEKVEESRLAFYELNARFPGDPSIILPLALLDEEQGNFDQAKKWLTKLTGIKHYNNPAHYYLGRIAEKQEKLELALNYYQKVGVSKEYLAAQFASAKLLHELKGIDDALAFLDESINVTPSKTNPLKRLKVDILINDNQNQRALEELTLLLIKDPYSPDLLYTRSMVAEKMSNHTLMEADLRLMIDKHPDQAEAYNALGYSLTNRNDRLDEAERLLNKAIALNPTSMAITDSLGWLYFKQGKYEQAGKLLKKAWSNMKDHEVAAHLGEWYWTMDKKKSAKAIWKSGLELNPESKVILDTLFRFQLNASDL